MRRSWTGWTAGYAAVSSEDLRRARRTAGAVIVSVVAYSVGIVIVLATGQAVIAIPLFLTLLALVACGVALKANIAIVGISNAFIAVNAVLLYGMLLATGGESVGFLIGMPVVPAFAMLVGNRRAVVFWSGMTIAAIAATLVLSWLGVTFPIRPNPAGVAIAKFYAAIVVIGIILGIADLIWKDWANILQALQQSHDREKKASEQLRIAAQTAKLGYWSFDYTDAKYLNVSDEFAEIFGYTADVFINRFSTLDRDMELIHPEDRVMVAEVYESGEKFTVEYRIVRADGSVRTVLETVRNVPDTPDGHLRYDGTLQDITELRQVEVELRAAKEAAEAASRAKSEFLANMSHELRTPLTTIIGYSEILQDESEDRNHAATISDLRKINAAGLHLLSLISDVLDLSKIEAGKTDMQLTRFAVKDLVNEVVATCSQLIEKNSNTLDLVCSADVGMMRSDMTKMRQVLFNLLSNAAKFTKDGHIEVNVRRDIVGGDAVIVLEVRDSGIGITLEQAKTVFDAFVQVRNSAESGESGTGLGLTITQEYCHLLGGKLEIFGTPGEGSVFTATLLADISVAHSVADHGYPDTRNSEDAEYQSRKQDQREVNPPMRIR